MPNVGFATLSIIPSMRGAQSAIASQLSGPLKAASGKSGKDSGESFMSGFAGKAKLLAIGAGAVIGGALAKGFSDFIANDRALDKTAAAFGLDVETSERLGDAAGRVYADAYGESLGQVSHAIALVQQGLGRFDTPIADLEQMTIHALDFATAFDTDVNEAITAASLLVKNGLAKDGVEAFDLLTIASQQLAPAMRDELLSATNEYSQFFSALGLTGEEAFAGLVRAAQRGGNYGVDKFGDAMKELTIRATDMSATSVEAYSIAGLNAEKMAKRFLAGGDRAKGALDDLIDGLLDIKDPVRRANAAIGLFGTPLEDLSVSEIPDFLAGLSDLAGGLGDVGGAAAAMGDTLNNNAATKIEAFKRTALMRLSNFVGNTVIPALERLAPTFQAGLAKVQSWVDQHWPQIQAVITGAVDTISNGIGGFVSIATTLWQNFGNNILSFVQRVWPNVQQVIGGALDIIQGIIQTATSLIKGDWSGVWDGIEDIVSGAWQAIQGLVKTAMEGLRLTVGVGLEVVGSVIKGAWDGIVSFVAGIPDRIASAAVGMFDGIKNAFKSAINWLIRAWNKLEFKIPGFDPPGPGPKFSGFTLGVPKIAELALGGIVKARPGGTLAILGEAGRDEAVVPLGADTHIRPLTPSFAQTSRKDPTDGFHVHVTQLPGEDVITTAFREAKRVQMLMAG